MVEPFAVTPEPRGTSYHSYLLIGDPVDEDGDEE